MGRIANRPVFVLGILAAAGLAASVAVFSAQQKPATPRLSDAIRRLQAGDAAGAATLLDRITKAEPTNGRAWRTYGTALQRSGRLRAARDAFQRALAVDDSNPSPLLNLASVDASLGHPANALAWLRKAKATGKLDLTQMTVDPTFASLKSEPAFAALLPRSDEFEQPFLEPVHIVREWDGEAANDQFGWIARRIEDVDGDGVPDVVTSAPTHGRSGDEAGRVYVYSTRSGKLLWLADGHAHDQLGTGVESAGDTNHDGIPDVVATAPGSGHAFVYSGRDGRVLLTLSAEGGARDDFGRHASGVGDVDGDGYDDIIVGAPGNGAGGPGAGRAYVYSGRDGRILLTLTGERKGDAFGSTVAGRADGRHTFLIVGAPKAGARNTGRVYVYDRLSPTPKFVIDSDDTGAALGAMFVSVPGDVDGDGVPDVYASDWSNEAHGPSTGRVYVHSGKDGRRLLTLTGATPGEGFGIGPATAGDVDGDGYADLIVGSWQYGETAVSAGRAVLFSGRTGERLKTYTSRIPGETFGFDAVGMGDVDGDGAIDLLITSGWSAVHGFHSGRVFIISSGVHPSRHVDR